MILYKYTDIMTALEIIIQSTVKFTFAIHFNDPLEISTCYFGKNDSTNFMLQNTYGILSLTRTPLNPIMWASYASGLNIDHKDKSEHYLNKIDLLNTLDNSKYKGIRLDIDNHFHTGVVFGIDCDIAKLNNNNNVLPAKHGNIIYTKTKPFFDYSNIQEPNLITGGVEQNFNVNNIELLQKFFLYKSDDWSYEEEVRVIKNTHRLGIENGIVPIDRKAIKEVYIGNRNAYNDKYIANFSKIAKEYLPDGKIYLCKDSEKSWAFTGELLALSILNTI